ncbi:hypothetical protein [Nocardia tengchongensis]|uniref:hypothetical protein n=1 Tax=Nocardia tengchongensis TaxID=2055889 RepID=UPI00369F2C1A
MRIFRDHDHEHDGDDEHDDERPRKNLSRDEIAAQAEVMADEIADFLSDVADDNPSTAPAARPMAGPEQPVTAVPTEAGDPVPVSAANPRTRGRIWRASAAGSSVVVGLAATAAWGQPAEVGVPIVLYGLGWIAYLSWDAARRPSPSLALAAFTEHRAARTLRNAH